MHLHNVRGLEVVAGLFIAQNPWPSLSLFLSDDRFMNDITLTKDSGVTGGLALHEDFRPP